MSKINASEIKTLLKKFKDSGNKLGYATGLGAKPEDTAFNVHKSKKPNALMTELKGDKTLKKVGCGTLEVKGTELILSQIKKVSGIERLLSKQLKAAGVKYVVKLAEGGDGGEDPAAKAEEEKINKEIEALEKEIDDLLKQVA
ncbi:MAG: hypothetical protein AAGC57_08860 [Pseudomonadota bacterium]